MNLSTRKLHKFGQRIWLDNITRHLLTSGTLKRYISDMSVTGLTTNPTIFEQAISAGSDYDEAIRKLLVYNFTCEGLFFELALEDLTQAAGLFGSIFDASNGVDGWVSLGISPLLANDTLNTVKAAAQLHARAALPNLFITIPGTPAGIAAIEQSIFDGIPINVSLLFSREHYVAAAQAYLRGLERRLEAGLDLRIESVASLFISQWDTAVKEEISPQFHNRLSVAIAMQTYKAYRDLLASERWRKLAAAGARPQRLLWASTGTTDPALPVTLYVDALVTTDTVNTIPEGTLLAYAEHGKLDTPLPADGGFAEVVIEEFRREGVDVEALAARLQSEGVETLVKSWRALLLLISEKSLLIATARVSLASILPTDQFCK